MLWGEILSPFCSENGLLCLFASFPKVFPKRCYSRRGCKQGLMQWFTWLQCVGLLPLDSFGCSTQGSNHCGCQSGGTSDIWQLLLSRDHESILHCKQLNKQKKKFICPSLPPVFTSVCFVFSAFIPIFTINKTKNSGCQFNWVHVLLCSRQGGTGRLSVYSVYISWCFSSTPSGSHSHGTGSPPLLHGH